MSFLGLSSPAKAQTVASAIKISPVKIEEVVDPGASIQKTITVTNQAGISRRFYVYLRDFKAEGEGGAPRLIMPGSEEGSFLASWIEAPTEGIDFGPGESKTITFTINVPQEAGPGGYYGAVIVGSEPPRLDIKSEDRGAGMAISQQAATLLLFQVKGRVSERAEIREFSTDKQFYNTPFEVNFLTRIENLGNVHIKPLGHITVYNFYGEEVTKINFNERGANILPHSIRRFDHKWRGERAFGKYRATLGLSYGTPPEFGGQGRQTLYTEITFWIFPWRLLTLTVLGLLFVGSLIILFLRLYKNKAIQRAMEQAGIAQVRYVKKYYGPSPTLHLLLIITVILLGLTLVLGAVYFLIFA
ncbi:hypothetical protein D6821_00105 [Candidatus Parcubacteria bacterium]|nr:MAG: hypothetical protein D6821_00105 [Candidatus Parcubacteria bacterium]